MSFLVAARNKNIQLYFQSFSEIRPPIFAFFPGGKTSLFPFGMDSDRGMGILLLTASLYRPGGEGWSAQIIAGLFESFGVEIFKLNRIPFSKLFKALSKLPQWPDPEEQKKVPGILRSVCDFFYGVGGLGNWLSTSTDWEVNARELCESIFWMGKRSRLRTKARYFFWLISFQPDFGKRYKQAYAFQWPISEGHARFYHNLLQTKYWKAFTSPEAKLTWFYQLGKQLLPKEPWRLFIPLQAYLNLVQKSVYACREVQGDCSSCPLNSICPVANRK